MYRYIARRLLALIPTLFGVSLVVFLFLRLIPGDPATAILRENATAEQVAALNQRLGLDKPLYLQYVDYVGRLLRGDLGEGYFTRVPVGDDLRLRFPATVELAVAAVLIATIVGVVMGIVAAIRRGSAFDYGTMTLSLIGVSMPIFWLGLMFIFLFAVDLRWLPPSTRGEQPDTMRTGLYLVDYLLLGDLGGFLEAAKHLFLPAIVLATVPLAVIARQTRSAMLEILSQDFVRTAWSKGLRERVIVVRHVLRNALLPVVTVIGLQIGGLLSGAVLTETVFSWPGVGTFVLDAIVSRDYPVVQSVVLIFALVYVLVNLVVDISYAWLDPRIRYG